MNNDNLLETHFDIAERKTIKEVFIEYEEFENDSLLMQVLEGFPEIVLVLNEYRQIVAWNSKSLELFNTKEKLDILSKRFGEAIKCIHQDVMAAGCGTAKFCQECGSAKAIKNTNDTNVQSIEECRITSNLKGIEESYDFRVHTRPFIVNGKRFTLYALKDIADEKRRQSLERIFFHDVLNTTGAISGLANMLKEAEDEEELTELTDALIDSSTQLLHEIKSQRELRNAEEGNLTIEESKVTVNKVLNHVCSFYKKHELAKNKNFITESLENDYEFYTDNYLLVRSLGNLVKNALEASGKDDDVKIYTTLENGQVFFHVYNNKVIPENIQLQIFQRSFTTKGGAGRGIGTYSVKLLVEQYLKGKVDFISNEDSKTVFTITLPNRINQE